MKAVMTLAEERQEPAYTGTTGYSIIILKELLGFSEDGFLNAGEFPLLKDLISAFDVKKSFTEIKEKIEFLIKLADKTERHFKILSKNPDSVTLVTERENICRLIGIYKNCLIEIEQSIEMPVEKLFDSLKETSRNIFLSIIRLKETEDVLYYNHCITCGYGNRSERKYCKSCLSPIQRFSEYVNPVNRSFLEEEDSNKPCSLLTCSIRSIIRETEKFQKGKKSSEDFIKEIEEFISLISTEKVAAEITQERGIEIMLEGLYILKENAIKDRKINLFRGINLFMEGANKLYYIQKRGEEAERSLEHDA
jgi:hypothetical protein